VIFPLLTQPFFFQMTTHRVKSLPLKPTDGKPLQVPYDFFPEFKPQQLGVEFRLIVNDAVSNPAQDHRCKNLLTHIYDSKRARNTISTLTLEQ
jgi:hypothetical protein